MGPSAVRENKHTPVTESIFSFMRVGGLGMGKIIWKEGSFYLLKGQTCSKKKSVYSLITQKSLITTLSFFAEW